MRFKVRSLVSKVSQSSRGLHPQIDQHLWLPVANRMVCESVAQCSGPASLPASRMDSDAISGITTNLQTCTIALFYPAKAKPN